MLRNRPSKMRRLKLSIAYYPVPNVIRLSNAQRLVLRVKVVAAGFQTLQAMHCVTGDYPLRASIAFENEY